jgi:hypothetical protein
MKNKDDMTLGDLVKLMGGSKPKPRTPKPPHDYTIEEVMEMLQNSATDHDVGWANVEHAPIFFHHNDKTEAHRAFVILKPIGYNTTDKRFKITIEESY